LYGGRGRGGGPPHRDKNPKISAVPRQPPGGFAGGGGGPPAHLVSRAKRPFFGGRAPAPGPGGEQAKTPLPFSSSLAPAGQQEKKKKKPLFGGKGFGPFLGGGAKKKKPQLFFSRFLFSSKKKLSRPFAGAPTARGSIGWGGRPFFWGGSVWFSSAPGPFRGGPEIRPLHKTFFVGG